MFATTDMIKCLRCVRLFSDQTHHNLLKHLLYSAMLSSHAFCSIIIHHLLPSVFYVQIRHWAHSVYIYVCLRSDHSVCVCIRLENDCDVNGRDSDHLQRGRNTTQVELVIILFTGDLCSLNLRAMTKRFRTEPNNNNNNND